MSEFVFKLPDLGEGTVEAEIIEWHVVPGDEVSEGDIIVDVMTDKANIEVPSPVSGRVLRTTGEPGDMVAVGAELIAFNTGAEAEPKIAPQTTSERAPVEAEPAPQEPPAPVNEAPRPKPPSPMPERGTSKVLASPALRRRANELGIDLGVVQGSGPRGRILRRDLDGYVDTSGSTAAGAPREPVTRGAASDEVEEIKVIGVRRVIAERMQRAKQEIPHFAYVEELDVTELDRLRNALLSRHPERSITYLPLIATALMRALTVFPQCNQRFDAQRGVLQRYRNVHLGIATQTPDGLKVPVVRNAQALDLWQLGDAIRQVTERARDGSASPQELSGSTITITSLGKLGGIVSTPVINAPEMGIIGVNKALWRPMIVEGAVVPRLMMNLSSSFDHRFVDGFDAASMIQEMKTLLEHPALMFASP